MAISVLPDEDPSSDATLDALYADHAPRLRRVVARRVGDPHLAEDIVQETFLRAYRFSDRLDPDRPAWPWLRTIALRLAVNATRLRHFDGEDLVAEPTDRAADDQPAIDAERQDRRAVLVQMLESLPERDRRLLVLRDMYGVSFDEIAASERVNVTALRKASSRARKTLRSHALMSRLGALAPVGWAVRTTRRLRRVFASAPAIPVSSVIGVALVIAVVVSTPMRTVPPLTPTPAAPPVAHVSEPNLLVEPIAHEAAAPPLTHATPDAVEQVRRADTPPPPTSKVDAGRTEGGREGGGLAPSPVAPRSFEPATSGGTAPVLEQADLAPQPAPPPMTGPDSDLCVLAPNDVSTDADLGLGAGGAYCVPTSGAPAPQPTPTVGAPEQKPSPDPDADVPLPVSAEPSYGPLDLGTT